MTDQPDHTALFQHVKSHLPHELKNPDDWGTAEQVQPVNLLQMGRALVMPLADGSYAVALKGRGRLLFVPALPKPKPAQPETQPSGPVTKPA